jgi:hypothetical protein
MVDLLLKGGFLTYPILLGCVVGVAILIDKFIQYRKIFRELKILLSDMLGKWTPGFNFSSHTRSHDGS